MTISGEFVLSGVVARQWSVKIHAPAAININPNIKNKIYRAIEKEFVLSWFRAMLNLLLNLLYHAGRAKGMNFISWYGLQFRFFGIKYEP